MKQWVAAVVRQLGWEVAAVRRSASRAVRHPGPERDTVVQAGKAAGAAIAAWALAGYWIRDPMALLAPWTAVALVEVTVYRSLRAGLQQLAIIMVGAVGASLAMAATGGATLPAMAICLPVLALIGTYRRLGAHGIYGATTALFVITYGAYRPSQVGDRLLETVIGAAVGTGVNALVLPPLHLSDVRDNLEGLARESADLLRSIADGLGGEWGEAEAAGWQDRARRLEDRVAAVAEARRWSAESRRLNPGRRIRRVRPAPPPDPGTDRRWETVVRHLIALTRSLSATAERSPVLTPPAQSFLNAYTTVADTLSHLCANQADALSQGLPQDTGPAREQGAAAWTAYSRLSRDYQSQQPGAAAAVSGGLLVETKQLLTALAPHSQPASQP